MAFGFFLFSLLMRNMKLSIPYIPDTDYTDYLQTKIFFLESVYFTLHCVPALDSRIRVSSRDIQTLARGLSSFSRIKKYCLLNTRFIHPDLYLNKDFLTRILDQMEALRQICGLDGVVFTDFYLIQGLSCTGHPVVSELEAIPGVNSMIDNAQKALAILDMIETTRFAPPGKIILDRALNRDLEKLEATVQALKSAVSGIKIELLANEGCMYQCPFKPAHDAQISLSNTGLVRETTHRLNQELGCHAFFHGRGHQFLKSPFIRPEDLYRYNSLADSIKLCGRTLGKRFLMRCTDAYAEGSFDGNLFDLMDAAHFLSAFYFLDNKKLDPGFFQALTSCTKNCRSCTLCADRFSSAARKNNLLLQPYEETQ